MSSLDKIFTPFQIEKAKASVGRLRRFLIIEHTYICVKYKFFVTFSKMLKKSEKELPFGSSFSSWESRILLNPYTPQQA